MLWDHTKALLAFIKSVLEPATEGDYGDVYLIECRFCYRAMSFPVRTVRSDDVWSIDAGDLVLITQSVSLDFVDVEYFKPILNPFGK